MKLVLDTHTLLWFIGDDPRLSTSAKAALENVDNERWLSPIRLLEIAVKVSIGHSSNNARPGHTAIYEKRRRGR